MRLWEDKGCGVCRVKDICLKEIDADDYGRLPEEEKDALVEIEICRLNKIKNWIMTRRGKNG